MLLAGMEGSSLGVWVAHGEGRAHFPDPASRKSAVDGGLAPVRRVFGWGAADTDVCFFLRPLLSPLRILTGWPFGYASPA